jgi:hypothetical protein
MKAGSKGYLKEASNGLLYAEGLGNSLGFQFGKESHAGVAKDAPEDGGCERGRSRWLRAKQKSRSVA